MLDTAALTAFVTVAEHRSFSMAAQTLFLTQPAVSKRVAHLEAALGTRLFDRTGRELHLTEAGSILLPRARRILAELEASRQAIADMTGTVSGRLRLGTSHHIGLHYLPPILRTYTQRFPAVELDLHFMDSEEVCRAVAHGDLEMGVVTLPLEPVASLQVTPVWREELSVVAARSHPLATQTTLSIRGLIDYRAILPARGTFTRALIDKAFAGLDAIPHAPLSTNHLETIKMLVTIGLGWSVLPRTLIDKDLNILSIFPTPLIRDLGVITHCQRTATQAAQQFVRSIGTNNVELG